MPRSFSFTRRAAPASVALTLTTLALAVLIPVAARASSTPGDDWRSFRGDDALSGLATEALPPPLELAWTYEIEAGSESSPAIVDGRAYVAGCDGYFRGIGTQNGEEGLKISLDGYVAGSAAIRGERAYVGSFENEVLAIDLAKAQVAWRYSHPERDFPFYSSPAVNDEIVVIGGRDKIVHALDPATGQSLWTFATRARVDASPVISGEVVYVADRSGDLRALELDSGAEAWSFETGEAITGSPALAQGRLVVATLDGTVFAFVRKRGS